MLFIFYGKIEAKIPRKLPLSWIFGKKIKKIKILLDNKGKS